jgi:hypothetical protein
MFCSISLVSPPRAAALALELELDAALVLAAGRLVAADAAEAGTEAAGVGCCCTALGLARCGFGALSSFCNRRCE